MVKHAAPHMIARGYGKIINIGSGTAFRGIPNFLHYVTSKGGIMALTRALSRELGQHGICVNTLAPGFTLSDSIVEQNPGHVNAARESAVRVAPFTATSIPRISPERSSFSPQRIATSSPDRRSRLMAAA